MRTERIEYTYRGFSVVSVRKGQDDAWISDLVVVHTNVVSPEGFPEFRLRRPVVDQSLDALVSALAWRGRVEFDVKGTTFEEAFAKSRASSRDIIDPLSNAAALRRSARELAG